jgi:hypothetical protein
MKLLRQFCIGVMLVAGVGAQAAPINQTWINANPDAERGLFDMVAFRFVSQSPAKPGFYDVVIAPPNGWASLGFDPLLTYAAGDEGDQLNFTLVFDGLATDIVQWEIWYFRDHVALGGALFAGDIARRSFTFTLLDVEDSPAAVPEPSSLLLIGLALLAGCVFTGRRSRQQTQH